MTKATRREVFPQLAGHRALDLLNTVGWRLAPERQYDALTSYDDLLRWGHQTGLIGIPETGDHVDAAARERELQQVVDLRENVYAMLFEAGTVEVFTAAYRDAVGRSMLQRDGESGFRWVPNGEGVALRDLIALDVHDLVTRTDLSLLAQCQDDACGWVFLDESPRRNRRWCDSADCGNRNRARAHYRRERQRAGAVVDGR